MKVISDFFSEKYRLVQIGDCGTQLQYKPRYSCHWYPVKLFKLFYEAKDAMQERIQEKRSMKNWGKAFGVYKILEEVTV